MAEDKRINDAVIKLVVYTRAGQILWKKKKEMKGASSTVAEYEASFGPREMLFDYDSKGSKYQSDGGVGAKYKLQVHSDIDTLFYPQTPALESLYLAIKEQTSDALEDFLTAVTGAG